MTRGGKNRRKSLGKNLRGTGLSSPRAEARPSSGQAARVRWITGIALLLSLTFIFLFIQTDSLPSKGLSVGDVVRRDIKAGEDFLVEDEASTTKIRREAERAVRDVYDLDSGLARGMAEQVRAAFLSVRKAYESAEAERKSAPPFVGPRLRREGSPAREGSGFEEGLKDTQAFLAAEGAFYRALGLEPEATLVAALREQKYGLQIGEEVARLLEQAAAPGIVSNKELLLAQAGKGIQIREVGSTEEVVVEDVEQYPDASEALQNLEALATRLRIGDSLDERRLSVLLTSHLIQPNLTLNKQATEERRREAREEAKPVYFQIKKGEMIVREGARITPEHRVKLRGLAALQETRGILASGIGVALLMALFLALTWIYLSWFKTKLIRSTSMVILLAVLLLGTVLLISVFIQLGNILSEGSDVIEATSYYYAVPFAVAAMLAAILVDLEVALLFSALTAFLAGLLIPAPGISYALMALVGGLVASFRVNQYHHRSSILITGLFIGLANVAVLIPLHLMEGGLTIPRGLLDLLMGIAGGGVVAILVSAFLPFLESLFKVTSDIKLLELADLNHPILRQLVVQAPGTYHHSVIVGNLAEEAAERTGANSLLARVSAYYHDIGKIRKPEYFIENQSGPENKHDRLAPRMSSLILISHVKDGIELARKYHLPEKIIDFIPQHHGTSLIPYFYNKAKEREVPGHETVEEEDFRYPGPKPQIRETAIVLLADMVEAASRTLTDPHPARIRSMVKGTINRVFAEGQLEECDLTLRDLNLIAEAFVRILTGIFHHRVEYPGQRKAWGQEKPEDVDSADRSTKEDSRRLGLDRREGTTALRDLGLSG